MHERNSSLTCIALVYVGIGGAIRPARARGSSQGLAFGCINSDFILNVAGGQNVSWRPHRAHVVSTSVFDRSESKCIGVVEYMIAL